MLLKTSYFRLILFWCLLCCVRGQTTSSKARAEAALLLAENANHFAQDLYKALERKSNVVLSPVSIFTAMLMTSAGAKGQTQAQILRALYSNQDAISRNIATAGLINNLQNSNPPSVILETANFMWVPRGVSIRPDFARVMQEVFQTKVRDADFSRSEDVRLLVNQRISNFTRQKIQELLPRGSITPQTRLLLANAVYFKGLWLYPFDPRQTRYGPFMYDASAGRTSVVPMMHNADIFRGAVFDDLDAKAVFLLYNDNQHGLLLLLPNRYDGLAELEDKVTSGRYPVDLIMRNLIHRGVNLTLPKFQIKFDAELSQTLQKLGINELFTDNADLSGMSSLALRHRLKASGFYHQATIEVNEGGSEASAVSGMEITPLMGTTGYTGPIEFKADHPFMFFLVDEINGNLPLFMGRVTHPGLSDPADSRSQDLDIPSTNRNRFSVPAINENRFNNRPSSAAPPRAPRPPYPTYDEIIFPHTDDFYNRQLPPVYRRYDTPIHGNGVHNDFFNSGLYNPILYPTEDELDAPIAKRKKREALPLAWPADPASSKDGPDASAPQSESVDDRIRRDWYLKPQIPELLIPLGAGSGRNPEPHPQGNVPSSEPIPPANPLPFPATNSGFQSNNPTRVPVSFSSGNFASSPSWSKPSESFPLPAAPQAPSFDRPVNTKPSHTTNNFLASLPQPGFPPAHSSFASGDASAVRPFVPPQPSPAINGPILGPNAIIFPEPAIRIKQ